MNEITNEYITECIYKLNYERNIDIKNSVDTVINESEYKNIKINSTKLIDLIRRDMLILYKYDDNGLLIDYIDSKRENLFYKGKIVDRSNIKFYNYLIEFFLYGTTLPKIYLPLNIEFEPILMYRNQPIDEYLKCFNILLKLKYNYDDTKYKDIDLISEQCPTDISFFIDNEYVFRPYVQYYCDKYNKSMLDVLELEFCDDIKDVNNYLQYRAKYLLKNNILMPLNLKNYKDDTKLMLEDLYD